MTVSLDMEYNRICRTLTDLFKKEIRKQGLVSKENKPHLIDSIVWTAKKTSNGYNLAMESFDYFGYLDSKYRISENVFRTIEYQGVLDKIAELNVQFYLDELTKNIKTK